MSSKLWHEWEIFLTNKNKRGSEIDKRVSRGIDKGGEEEKSDKGEQDNKEFYTNNYSLTYPFLSFSI